jgi:hypothetical protein
MTRQPLAEVSQNAGDDEGAVPCSVIPMKTPAAVQAGDCLVGSLVPQPGSSSVVSPVRPINTGVASSVPSPSSLSACSSSDADSIEGDCKLAAVIRCMAKLRAANHENTKLQLRLARAQVRTLFQSLQAPSLGGPVISSTKSSISPFTQARSEAAIKAVAEKESELEAEQLQHHQTSRHAKQQARHHLMTIAELQTELEEKRWHLMGVLGELAFESGRHTNLIELQKELQQKVSQMEGVAGKAVAFAEEKLASLEEQQGMAGLQEEWASKANELSLHIAALEALVIKCHAPWDTQVCLKCKGDSTSGGQEAEVRKLSPLPHKQPHICSHSFDGDSNGRHTSPLPGSHERQEVEAAAELHGLHNQLQPALAHQSYVHAMAALEADNTQLRIKVEQQQEELRFPEKRVPGAPGLWTAGAEGGECRDDKENSSVGEMVLGRRMQSDVNAVMREQAQAEVRTCIVIKFVHIGIAIIAFTCQAMRQNPVSTHCVPSLPEQPATAALSAA